jgi:hypothetical protein
MAISISAVGTGLLNAVIAEIIANKFGGALGQGLVLHRVLVGLPTVNS